MSHRDIDEATPESFLMQARYLTIKKSEEEEYILDFPNYEVRFSFNHLILSSRYNIENQDYIGIRRAIRAALTNNNTEEFLEQIKVIFSSVTHHHYDANRNEYFYSALLLMFLQAAGFVVVSEKTSNQGRLDLLLTWKDKRIYIIELKLDSAEKALGQLIEKNYAGQYKNKECILIGLGINYKKRNIINWKVKIV